MKKIIVLFFVLISTIYTILAFSSYQIYDNFSSGALNESKWEISQDVEGQPLIDEYWVDNVSENFHTQQNIIGDQRVYLVPKKQFTTGDKIKYETNLVSKEGNYMQMILLTGDQYIRIGISGYINGIQGYDELGTSHIELTFEENSLVLSRESPSGEIFHDILNLNNHNGTYEIYIGTVSGDNGKVHIDYDNFEVYTEKPHLTCGDTIYEDTVMTEDLIDCPGDGLIIGADNITLDCSKYVIKGIKEPVSSGIKMENIKGVTIKNCYIERFHWAIRSENSDNNSFKNNHLNYNEQGFFILSSSNNLFDNNEASSNIWDGFYVEGYNNTLINNEANNNGYYGIKVIDSENKIINNSVKGNRKGISVTRSQYDFEVQIENNTIAYNNFSGYGDTTGVVLGECSSYPCYNSKITFRNNKIIGNYIGISYTNGFCDDNLEFNNIENNTLYNLVIGNPSGPTDYNCNSTWQENWWGTNIKEEIELTIIGNTTFLPFLCEPYSTTWISNSRGTCLLDQDNDGVADEFDKCPNTKLPEKMNLSIFRFGDIDGDSIFETKWGIIKAPVDSEYNLNSTYGCSCKQILSFKPGCNFIEEKFGCGRVTIEIFIHKILWAKSLF
jgi:parallel beta-helix repeat protein